ncbi:unnamed protein product [Ophioblennius macclurei]
MGTDDSACLRAFLCKAETETEKGGGAAERDDVISLSSGESDVEIVGVCNRLLSSTSTTSTSFSTFSSSAAAAVEPLPLSAVRVEVDDVKVNRYVDLTDPQWSFPHLKLFKRNKSIPEAIIDLTETDERDQKMENLPLDCQISVGSTILDISNKEDSNQQNTSMEDSNVLANVQGCVPRILQKEKQQENPEAPSCHRKPVIKLTRLPFLVTQVPELPTSGCSVNSTKDCTEMPLYGKELGNINKTQHGFTDFRTTGSNGQNTLPSLSCSPPVSVALSHMGLEQQENSKEVAWTKLLGQETQQQQSCAENCFPERNAVSTSPNKSVENKKEYYSSSMTISSPTVPLFQDPKKSEVHRSNLEKLDTKAVSHQSHSSSHSCPLSPVRLHTRELSNVDSLSRFTNAMSDVDLPPNSEIQESEMDSGGQSEAEPYCANTYDSPVYDLWQDRSDDEEDMNEESDFRVVTGDDRHYVSPAALKKFMTRPTQDLFDEDDEDGLGAPEELSRQRLSQVYTTIEVNYPEVTLQQLFDLLQPGYYLPGDIIAHLLRGILLNRQCSQYQCLQAFTLLMRTQRHHMADKTTVPWDWELLTSVMSNQESTDRHRSEIVRMLLEYIIETLEDDFHAKRCTSTLQHSIAKATVSCDRQISRVRDVMKWLFSVITKSTESKESNAITRERDEHIRMVKVFQRMLYLALEVDCSPALSVDKLSEELFHMLISNVPLRAHRMLLLETLQSKRLKCKLLKHLLDYACPMKTSLPMSLSLLLHFLNHSTLLPDPLDGAERWKKWDELVQLLWMLLLSYNKAMKGYLCSSKMDQRNKASTLVYKPHDVISAPAVKLAVEAFLSRSKADLGQDLPPHVEESLTYLQDHLLDACQKTPVV